MRLKQKPEPALRQPETAEVVLKLKTHTVERTCIASYVWCHNGSYLACQHFLSQWLGLSYSLATLP